MSTPKAPLNRTLDIYKGATFSYDVFVVDDADVAIDITGYSATLVIEDECDGVVLHTASTGNSQLTITGASGKVAIAIPAATTDAFTFTSGVYKLNVIDPSNDPNYLVMKGTVRVRCQ